MVDVAQLVRASVCGTECCGFNSHHPPHIYYYLQLISTLLSLLLPICPPPIYLTESQLIL